MLFYYRVKKILKKDCTYEERRFKCVSLRANMWIVPLSLEQQRNSESGLKLILQRDFFRGNYCGFRICDLEKIYQYRVAGSDPRRSSTRRVRFTVSHTRMRVPLSEAVATTVPCEFKAKQATSPWWALIVCGALEIPNSVTDRSYSID